MGLRGEAWKSPQAFPLLNCELAGLMERMETKFYTLSRAAAGAVPSQMDMDLEPEASRRGEEEQELQMERVLAEASAPVR